MKRHRTGRVGLTSLVAGATVAAATVGLATVGIAGPAAADTPPVGLVTLGAPTGVRIPADYLGLSFETFSVNRYFDPKATPALARELALISDPGGQQIRIGGGSTDESWWRGEGQAAYPGTWVGLDQAWLGKLAAYAATVPTRYSLGVNLGTAPAANSAAFAAAAARTLGGHLAFLELGNEPDGYTGHLLTHNEATPVPVRPSPYTFAQWQGEFTAAAAQIAAAAPGVPIAGPTTSSSTWASQAVTAGLVSTTTWHRYGTSACGVTPSSPWYPTVSRLLDQSALDSTSALAIPLARQVHAAGGQLRVSEVNSVACGGTPGVSDAFASALWAGDDLFTLAADGVDAADVHTATNTYTPIQVDYDASGNPLLTAKPLFYGLWAFRQAAPTGAALLSASGTPSGVKVWATAGTDGVDRALLLNKTAAPVTLRLATGAGVGSGAGAPSVATAQALSAPSVSATSGVTFGGQTIDPVTGRPSGTPTSTAIAPSDGGYLVTLPAYSGQVLSFTPGTLSTSPPITSPTAATPPAVAAAPSRIAPSQAAPTRPATTQVAPAPVSKPAVTPPAAPKLAASPPAVSPPPAGKAPSTAKIVTAKAAVPKAAPKKPAAKKPIPTKAGSRRR